MPEVGSIFVRLGVDAAALKRGLTDAEGAVRRTGQTLTRIGKDLSTKVTLPILAAGAAAVKMAADMEQTRVAFTTLIGDADRAGKVLKDIEEFAASTPFQFPELADASRKLIAFGVSADQSVTALRRIGDVAAGIGAPIGEIAELYGKARVQGRLFAEDVNQLTGRGIPIIQELAKQFGVADSEVKKLVESGKVGFPAIEQAFIDMTSEGGQFFELMQAQSQTLAGRFSTLKDNVGAVARELGEELLPVLGAIADKTLNVVKAFRGLDSGTKRVVLGFGAFAAAAGPVAIVLGSMFTNVGKLARGLKGLSIFLRANPWVLLATAVGAVALKFRAAGQEARAAALGLQANLKAANELRKGIADLNAEQAGARLDEVRGQEADALKRRALLLAELNELEKSGQKNTRAHLSVTVELARVNSELAALGKTSLALTNRYGEALEKSRKAASGVVSVVKQIGDETDKVREQTERTVKPILAFAGASERIAKAFREIAGKRLVSDLPTPGIAPFEQPGTPDTTKLRPLPPASEFRSTTTETNKASKAAAEWRRNLAEVGLTVRGVASGFSDGLRSSIDESNEDVSAFGRRFIRVLDATETRFEDFGRRATNVLGQIAGKAIFARQSIRGVAKELDAQGQILDAFFKTLFSAAGRAVGGEIGARIGSSFAPDSENRIQAAPPADNRVGSVTQDVSVTFSVPELTLPDVGDVVVPLRFDVAGVPRLPNVPEVHTPILFDVGNVPSLPVFPNVLVDVGFNTPDAPRLPEIPRTLIDVGFNTPTPFQLPGTPPFSVPVPSINLPDIQARPESQTAAVVNVSMGLEVGDFVVEVDRHLRERYGTKLLP